MSWAQNSSFTFQRCHERPDHCLGSWNDSCATLCHPRCKFKTFCLKKVSDECNIANSFKYCSFFLNFVLFLGTSVTFDWTSGHNMQEVHRDTDKTLFQKFTHLNPIDHYYLNRYNVLSKEQL